MSTSRRGMLESQSGGESSHFPDRSPLLETLEVESKNSEKNLNFEALYKG